MFAFTVQVPGGGVEAFDMIGPSDTVEKFKAAVSAGMKSFQLCAKDLAGPGQTLLKRDVDATSLRAASLADGDRL